MKSGAGSFFERIIHQTVKNLMPKPVNDVCWSKGNTDASLQQLDDTGVYWIPSVSSFASIDSALVHKHTLYSCQMTIAEKREFNVTSFRRKFSDKVKEAFRDRHEITASVVFVVVPKGTKYKGTKVVGVAKTPRTMEPEDDVRFESHEIAMADPVGVSDSVVQMMRLIV
jgi:hypothetical protein